MHETLWRRMLVGLVAGGAIGGLLHGYPGAVASVTVVTRPIGTIFLRLLFMLVVPLILSALTLGVVGLGDVRRLGRIGGKTLLYTVAVSTIAVLLGVTLMNVLRPGEGIAPELRERLHARAAQVPMTTAPKPTNFGEFVTGLVPSNPVKAMADGDMLAVMVFALLFGVGLTLTPTASARHLEHAMEGLYDVVMQLLGLVIRAAPVGVGCLMLTLTAELGWDILGQLGAYVGTVLLALAIHQFGVYAIAVSWLGGMAPRRFYAGIREAMMTAFATASSNATLPTAIRVAEEELRLPSHVARFVLTVGSTANQNGTALFEGMTVLFLAQFYGVELSVAQQITVVFICVLGGIGTAGVPAGSIPVIAMILGMVGVPPDGIGMILGVDRFLDMCRTTLNVTGDLAAAVVVSRGVAGSPPPNDAGVRP